MMTEQEQIAALRRELEHTQRMLAEAHKMASLGRLSAGIVHEINTPIGSIFSNNEVTRRSIERVQGLLAAEVGVPPKVTTLLQSVLSLVAVDQLACERIAGIVRSLKTFARVNESDLQAVDLRELLRDTVRLAQSVFKNRITFVIEFDELPKIECYPGLLNQVFLNLVVNAAQAIPADGTITLRTQLDGPNVLVSVRDTGQGIPPEVGAKIFSAGFTTKPIGEGTGLGLTITREIVVDTHGGTITFESAAGEGTTFYVRLPLTQPKRSESSPHE